MDIEMFVQPNQYVLCKLYNLIRITNRESLLLKPLSQIKVNHMHKYNSNQWIMPNKYLHHL